jgi:hypothetical protein
MTARRSIGIATITVESVKVARKDFIAGEPRNLFYEVAVELIDLASREMTKVSVAQALAVLLQTWNVSFYRFRKGFHAEDLAIIEALVNAHFGAIQKYRQRPIVSFSAGEEDAVGALFDSFEHGLGAVGAAKCLHLLAPTFFPLWDRAIAKAYRVKLDRQGYLNFMRITKEQYRVLTDKGAPWPDLLKAIDEYNYCTYTIKTKLLRMQSVVPHA